MKKISLSLLLAFAGSTFAIAQYTDKSTFVRVNAIYIDEVIEDGDESGEGLTAEFGFFVHNDDNSYSSLGLEVGYVESDADVFDISLDVELIPVFANYTLGGDIEDTGLLWEVGIGLGFMHIDFEGSSNGPSASDDDIVFSGQVFGRLGYEFSDGVVLLGGARYLKTDDAEVFDVDAGDLSSLAFDLGLKFMF